MMSKLRNWIELALLGPGTEPIEAQGPSRICFLVREEWHKPSFGLLRVVRLGLLLTLLLFPTAYIDCAVGSTRRSVVALTRDVYYLGVMGLFLSILFGERHGSVLMVVIVVYLLIGILAHLAGQVFAWRRYSIDPERSLLLAVMNYFQTAVAFAILYRFWDSLSIKSPCATQALYFSLVTGTTVGYGDITPVGSAGQILVMCQLGTSFLFATVFLSFLLGRTDVDET